MLIAMHETVTVKFDIDGMVKTFLSIIGVPGMARDASDGHRPARVLPSAAVPAACAE